MVKFTFSTFFIFFPSSGPFTQWMLWPTCIFMVFLFYTLILVVSITQLICETMVKVKANLKLCVTAWNFTLILHQCYMKWKFISMRCSNVFSHAQYASLTCYSHAIVIMNIFKIKIKKNSKLIDNNYQECSRVI